jgi:hypothetical protein
MRSELVLKLFEHNQKTSEGLAIDRESIDIGFREICQHYNVKELRDGFIMSRGRKNVSCTAFTTIAIVNKGIEIITQMSCFK